jgi:ribosomal protein S18 acetylase RimI-like enzyme
MMRSRMRDRQSRTIIVRAAIEPDAPTIASVHLASWLATYRGICADTFLDSLTAKTFEGYHRPRLQMSPEQARPSPFLVACDRARSDEIIGFARCGPTRAKSPVGDELPPDVAQRFSAELYAIYVHPERFGRGAGRAMFDAVVRELGALDHKTMCVWVLSQNAGARRFYERMGGTVAGEANITLDARAYSQVAYGWDRIVSKNG